MQARGPLMVEHRLIERMIAQIEARLERAKACSHLTPLFVDTVVDFVRIYADRTHHGKEEDILFRDLRERPLAAEDRRIMDDLIAEHIVGRQTVRELIAANERYRHGEASALDAITAKLSDLAGFYPKHIEKEDKVFFPAVRAYFTEEEDQAMLAEFWEFDRRMIHAKYKAVVQELAAA